MLPPLISSLGENQASLVIILLWVVIKKKKRQKQNQEEPSITIRRDLQAGLTKHPVLDQPPPSKTHESVLTNLPASSHASNFLEPHFSFQAAATETWAKTDLWSNTFYAKQVWNSQRKKNQTESAMLCSTRWHR